MTEPILQIENFEYTIKSNDLFQAPWKKTLWQIPSLTLESNGFTVLAGKNGSGKSTLLRCLLGLIRPTKGSALWFGKAQFGPSDLGYLPEIPIVPPAIKVKQWLRWLTSERDFKRLMEESKNNELLSALSVEPFLEVTADRLSKGQSQRVFLWSALAHSPKVLLLDEPFSGLDPWAREQLSQLIIQIVNKGCHVLISTHELTKSLRAITTKTWLIENQTVTAYPGCVLPE